MMVLWSIGGPPLGVYCVVQNFNIPVQVQPQIFTALTLVINAQILIYYHKWSTGRAVAVMGGFAAFLGGFEVLMILALRVCFPNLCALVVEKSLDGRHRGSLTDGFR